MPFQNIITQHLTPAERDQVFDLIDQLQTLLQPYLHNLSPEQNKRLGRISERNKLFVKKVQDYHKSQPNLSSPDVDWAEYNADMQSRETYELAAARLTSLAKTLTETRRLHDYDVYKNASIDYQYAKYKDHTQQGTGYDIKAEDLKQFFQKSSTKNSISDNL